MITLFGDLGDLTFFVAMSLCFENFFWMLEKTKGSLWRTDSFTTNFLKKFKHLTKQAYGEKANKMIPICPTTPEHFRHEFFQPDKKTTRIDNEERSTKQLTTTTQSLAPTNRSDERFIVSASIVGVNWIECRKWFRDEVNGTTPTTQQQPQTDSNTQQLSEKQRFK